MLVLENHETDSEAADGWYFFQNWTLTGPTTVDKCLNKASAHPSTRNIQIRHKGFCMWYATEDLIRISYGRNPPVQIDYKALNSILLNKIETLQNLRGKIHSGRKGLYNKIDFSYEDMIKQENKLYEALLPGKQTTYLEEPTKEVIPSRINGMELDTMPRSPVRDAPSIILEVLIKIPLTMGLSMILWLDKLMTINSEMFDKSQISFWKKSLVVLPFLNLLAVYPMARKLMDREETKFTSTSAMLLLAACPPLLMIYVHISTLCYQEVKNLRWVYDSSKP